MQNSSKPIELFFSYASEDEALCKELEKHLVLLRQQKLIISWHRRLVAPGTDWTRVIDEHLQRSSVILLLISSNFLNSEYCYGVEMKRALEQCSRGQARVIPILLRHVNWRSAPFGHLQPLPTDARPITAWEDQDEAFANVALGIHQAIEDFARPGVPLSLEARAMLKSLEGHTVLGDRDITIGRAPDNTYVINDLAVSGHHAVIRRHGQGYTILDLKSKNGTIVNDQELVPEMARILKSGDSICVGMVTFEYSDNVSVVPTVATFTRGTTSKTKPHIKTKQRPKDFPTQESSQIDLHRLPSKSMLKQRYRLLEIVGQGGMGRVYIAQDTQQTNRLVAVKEMNVNRSTPQEIAQVVEQFQHEANVLISLKHPNLPIFYESFGERNRWYLVMSFIEGQNLQVALNSTPGNKLPVDEVVRIGIEVCKILEYLHTHEPQVIFGDLKPGNIMITPHGDIYLIDFGIARHFKQEQDKNIIQFCSPGYASPEQYSQSHIGPLSDIYSLGVTLHQMLSGHNPINKPFQFSNLQLMDKTIPRTLTTLITQMLEMKEQARPHNVAEVREVLEKVFVSLPEKLNSGLTSASDTDEGFSVGPNAVGLQRQMISDSSTWSADVSLSYEPKPKLDNFFERMPEPLPTSSPVFISSEEDLDLLQPEDDFLEVLPRRATFPTSPMPRQRSFSRLRTSPMPRRETFSRTQTSPMSRQRPSFRAQTGPMPRRETFSRTQTSPMSRQRPSFRAQTGPGPSQKPSSRAETSPNRNRRSISRPTRSTSTKRKSSVVYRSSSRREFIFWVAVGMFLTLLFIIAYKLLLPTIWFWLFTQTLIVG